jgi:hypothetical protein
MSSRKPKPSPAIVRQRTEEILRILLDGAESPWDTCAYVREKEAEAGSIWEVPEDGKPLSDSQIRRYVAKATEMIAESCRASRKRLLRRHLAQRRNLYAKAVSQGDIRAALAVLDSEAKLTGLFDDEVMRLIDQLQKQIAELKAQHGNRNDSPASSRNGSGPENTPPTGDAAACGTNPARPGASDDRSGTDTGRVASEPVENELDASIAPLFQTGRQKPSGGSAGAI